MILLRHWKMILGLMAIFGAGVGTGGVGAILLLVRNFTTPVPAQKWVDDRMTEFDRKLKLTPEQKSKIRPIMEAAVEQFRAIGRESFERIIATAGQAHEDIANELTPEQQAELKKMRPHLISLLRDLSQREITIRGAGRHGGAPPRPEAETPPQGQK